MATIVLDESFRHAFQQEHLEWSRSLPRIPGSIGKVEVLPAEQRLVGGGVKYIGVPAPFLEVLTAKGIPFQVE